MYIDPFWGGVMTTVFAELLVIFLAAVVRIKK